MTRLEQAAVPGAVILVLGFQMACGQNGPTQPSPTSGVTVYEHPDYRGESYTFNSDFHRFDDLHGPLRAGLGSGARQLGQLRLFREDCCGVDGYRLRAR